MSTIISASEVTVRYNEHAVLDDITLGIQEGDRIGLVGRNGCGKTTFLKILAGLLAPDSGEISRQRELVASYLPQDFMLDAAKSVHENIRDGAQHVLNLIAEFESLPHDSKRHEHLEYRIATLEGWTLDRRIEVAMAHLNTPAGERRIESLSGGEKRRVAMCRAIVSRPDFLMRCSLEKVVCRSRRHYQDSSTSAIHPPLRLRCASLQDSLSAHIDKRCRPTHLYLIRYTSRLVPRHTDFQNHTSKAAPQK